MIKFKKIEKKVLVADNTDDLIEDYEHDEIMDAECIIIDGELYEVDEG